jgi:RNA polymerase II C-terminal domain phosphatase-like 1/2
VQISSHISLEVILFFPVLHCFYLCIHFNYFQEASSTGSAVNPTTASFVMPVAPGQNFIPSSAVPFAQPLGMMPLSNSQVPPPPFSQPVAQPGLLDPLQGSPAREEGEVPESELDPDTRRRLLILQHGQDTRDPTPPLPAAPAVQVPVPPVQPHGNWFPVDDGMKPNNLNRESAGFPSESDTMNYDKKQPPHPSYFHGGDNNPLSSDRFSYQNQRFTSQVGDLN